VPATASDNSENRVPEPDLGRLRTIFNAHRHAANVTFDDLAERSGVSRQTLLNISAGKYNGDLRTWLKLSRAFGIGLDDLLAEVWGAEQPDPGGFAS